MEDPLQPYDVAVDELPPWYHSYRTLCGLGDGAQLTAQLPLKKLHGPAKWHCDTGDVLRALCDASHALNHLVPKRLACTRASRTEHKMYGIECAQVGPTAFSLRVPLRATMDVRASAPHWVRDPSEGEEHYVWAVEWPRDGGRYYELTVDGCLRVEFRNTLEFEFATTGKVDTLTHSNVGVVVEMPHKPSPPAAERSLTFALRGIRAVSDAPQLTPLSPPLSDG